MSKTNTLTNAEMNRLMGALAPAKTAKTAKAKAKVTPAKVTPAKAKAEPKGLSLVGLPAPSGQANGVFAGVETNLAKLVIPAQQAPAKPTELERANVLRGLGVTGNAIKHVATIGVGMTSKSVIHAFIDKFRATHNRLPSIDEIDKAKLMCRLRGQAVDSRVNRANISPELWVYRAAYQLGVK